MTTTTTPRAQFPAGGEFSIHSHPIFILTRGEESELLLFDANMSVFTRQPYELSSKKRRVDVGVTKWVAKAWSDLLQNEIELRLSEMPQPHSFVTARDLEADLPGELEFNMKWDVLVGGQTLMSGLDGRAMGAIRSFPPTGDVFEIRGKNIQFEDMTVSAVACACASRTFGGRIVKAGE